MITGDVDIPDNRQDRFRRAMKDYLQRTGFAQKTIGQFNGWSITQSELSSWLKGKTKMKAFKLQHMVENVLRCPPQDIDPEWGKVPELLRTSRDGIGRRVIHIQMHLANQAQRDAAKEVRAAFSQSIDRVRARRYMPPKQDGVRRPRVTDEQQERFRQAALVWISGPDYPASKSELAIALGVSLPTISKWFSGTGRLAWHALAGIAAGLGKHPLEIDPDWDSPYQPYDLYEETSGGYGDAIVFRFTIESERQAKAVAALINSNPGMIERAKQHDTRS